MRKGVWEGKWEPEMPSCKAPCYINTIRIFTPDHNVEYVLRLLLYKGTGRLDRRSNATASMMGSRKRKSSALVITKLEQRDHVIFVGDNVKYCLK